MVRHVGENAIGPVARKRNGVRELPTPIAPGTSAHFSCACRPDGCPGLSLAPIFAFVPVARNTRSARQEVLVKIRLGQNAVKKRYGFRSNGNVNHVPALDDAGIEYEVPLQ